MGLVPGRRAESLQPTMFEHQNGTGHAPANSHSKHQWHGRATAEHSTGTCLQALLDARIDSAKMAGRSLVKLRAAVINMEDRCMHGVVEFCHRRSKANN